MVEIAESPYHRESDAEALLTVALWIFELHELVENAFLITFGDAWTLVPDLHEAAIAAFP